MRDQWIFLEDGMPLFITLNIHTRARTRTHTTLNRTQQERENLWSAAVKEIERKGKRECHRICREAAKENGDGAYVYSKDEQVVPRGRPCCMGRKIRVGRNSEHRVGGWLL